MKTTHYEYGYRTEKTGDIWETRKGADRNLNLWPLYGHPTKELYLGDNHLNNVDEDLAIDKILHTLNEAGTPGVAIRRKIETTYNDPETVGIYKTRVYD